MGLCFDKSQNRWFIHCRDGSYTAYARAVMECHMKRLLTSEEEVHHVNRDSTDDRLENLQYMPDHRAHMREHKRYDDQDLLQVLRDLAMRLDRIPTESDLKAVSGLPRKGTYRARFGGLINARALAGLQEVTER